MSIYEIPVKTIDGKDTNLGEYKGKTLLIVNVASKCGLTPQYEGLQKLYSEYKDKGFEILGVSLDKDRDAWLGAISSEGLTWPQVSDLKFWQSEACQIYAVQSIPYTVLIDKEGKIIATNLRGAELDKKLAEVLK